MGKRTGYGVLLTLLILLIGCFQNGDFSYGEESSFPGTVILSCPTNTQTLATVTTNESGTIYLSYGEGALGQKTSELASGPFGPARVTMTGLQPNKSYSYVINYKLKGDSGFRQSPVYHFSTPKTSGTSFNFVVQSDSHLLNKADPEIYRNSMKNMGALKPDFMWDMGDTFLLDNGGVDGRTLSQSQVNAIFIQQRPYMDIVSRNAPLFLTIGNHESQYGVQLDGTLNNLAAKSTLAKKLFFPNPTPNEFYSGNMDTEAAVGTPENYYGFTWGDALFLSIDPYRYSLNGAANEQKSDGWGWTLGKKQYDWFRSTLENSHAKYKFVFSHHSIGNLRGGAAIAKLYEWGGYDKNGQYLFDQKRPNWGKPIQQIMKDTGVTVFFQGHDHLFAREVVDGVVYQTVPKPAEKIADKQSNYNAYSGDVLHNSGFLNVSVSASGVQIDYNRNYLVASGPQTTGVVYSYRVDSNHQVTVLKKTADVIENYGKNEVSSKKKTEEKGVKGSDGLKTGSTPLAGSEMASPGNSLTTVPTGGHSIAIEADPHFDENSQWQLLEMTAANINRVSPNLMIDLGDTTMLEKLGKTPEAAAERLKTVEQYFSHFGKLPIKRVTGNHDVQINNGSPNYYSFMVGNSLYIVLDPYSNSRETLGKGGGWASTLGKTQYDWLKTTLSNSKAPFKFVFIHHLTGGIGKDSRGGAEAAKYYEWGGLSNTGKDEFQQMRPGWEMPIHELLVKYGVQAVFHGHDHFYGKQTLDGIVYQLVPQPGTPGNSVGDAAAYGYEKGLFLSSAGFIRMVVSPNEAVVEYLKTQEDGKYTIANVYRIPVNNQ